MPPKSYLAYWYPVPPARPKRTIEADVCVYGATPAGIAAAIQAVRLGHSAVIAEFGRHAGGMTASGLGATDFGNKGAIGGIAREFYRHPGEHYGIPEAWTFEPHVAEQTFLAMLAEAGVKVFFEHRLESVEMADGRIVELRMENGNGFRAREFVDATYEGDVMAKAGVSYTIGREANAKYGETLDGVQLGRKTHQFKVPVDPYMYVGDPDGGLLKGISADDPGEQGSGDRRVQAYNFRLCLTNLKANMRPFPKPEGYDPTRYVLLARYIEAGVWDALDSNIPMPRSKTDLNNNGGFSSDNIGMNYEWPDGDYDTRERIFQDHVAYQQGMMWYLTHDERVPERIRDQVGKWGLPKDEFPETGGWPYQLYIREGRRMVSAYVMTEHNCLSEAVAKDSIGLGAYNMDSHNAQRFVLEGRACNEGDVQVPSPRPYPISYRAIVPRPGECTNLVVPVCLSSSHIAYGSIRMEPVFMVLGQSAGTAAALAIEGQCAVQAVDYPTLRECLLREGQVLSWPP